MLTPLRTRRLGSVAAACALNAEPRSPDRILTVAAALRLRRSANASRMPSDAVHIKETGARSKLTTRSLPLQRLSFYEWSSGTLKIHTIYGLFRYIHHFPAQPFAALLLARVYATGLLRYSTRSSRHGTRISTKTRNTKSLNLSRGKLNIRTGYFNFKGIKTVFWKC